MKFIETLDELRSLYTAPSTNAVRKQIPAIDPHAARFIARAPLVAIGSQDDEGNADVTPKGDAPGFVQVLDETTLAIPDRPGNNRLDTFSNVIRNPSVGLLFMIPGMNETLRVNGRARITADATLCEKLAVNGRPAKTVMIVQVREVFLHCAKAYMRSDLWKPETWPDRSEMPSLIEMIKDQLSFAEAREG
ncbi:pyridoxamine 5'-phosphate oxidase family protein [Chelativorans sp. AA-79]|uniref:pyridoxamine 5'-phosphate oxidase family protein n=1 Tax=Chelativorans sp. AA-79 TaxID=3028735 RepID=UPI0023F80B6F|nr:pyridoxamine 5'-phosphate oxidase family protein [Chelativorans sp. AA-79]WEX09667.1 pyridoxamine 5'-phosphate oxidase family protein [Chelativorans sp. AA-79]